MTKSNAADFQRNYDVCLSFAGEDRSYVEKVAHELRTSGVRVFYDEFETVSLWGKDLYSHLSDIYQHQSTYCVIFVSQHYAKKAWTKHERASAQARAFDSNVEYILPVKLDNTAIPGVLATIGYVDLTKTDPTRLAKLIAEKIGPRPRDNYFPPSPDRLFKQLGVRSKRDRAFINETAHRLFEALSRMTVEERGLIYDIFIHCCPAELPENVHIDLDLLRRITHMPVTKIKRIVGGINSLGFVHSVRSSHDPSDPFDTSGPILVLEWEDRSLNGGGNHTFLLNEMIVCASAYYCSEHAKMMFKRLDFGQLSSSTVTNDDH